MRPLLELVPLEVLDSIIDMVATEDEVDAEDYSNVKACSLTCRTFLPRCRKHIFYTIEIDTKFDPAVFDKFSKLIEHSPWVADHVRALRVECPPLQLGHLDQSPSRLLSAFDRLMNLHAFSLYLMDYSKADWTQIQPQVRSSLLRLMHLPSIVCLSIGFIVGFPSSEFTPCANLKSLVLDELILVDDHAGSPSDIPTKPIKLDRLLLSTLSAQNFLATVLVEGRASGKAKLDLGELKSILLSLDSHVEECHHQILKYAHRLQTIDLCMAYMRTSTSNIASLVVSALDSLRFLNIHIETLYTHTLYILCGELQKIAGRNSIEGLTLNINVNWPSVPRIQSMQWELLDKLFLAPGHRQQWPSLRRVDLGVYVDYHNTFLDLEVPAEHKVVFEDAMKEVHDSQLSGLRSNEFFDFRHCFSSDHGEYWVNVPWL